MTALAFSIDDAAKACGLSTQTLDRAIKAGALRVKRTSVNGNGDPAGKKLVLASELQAFLDALPDG